MNDKGKMKQLTNVFTCKSLDLAFGIFLDLHNLLPHFLVGFFLSLELLLEVGLLSLPRLVGLLKLLDLSLLS